MPKPNYQYEKRQRELAKKAKKAEKAARKATRTDEPGEGPAEDEASPQVGAEGAAPEPGTGADPRG